MVLPYRVTPELLIALAQSSKQTIIVLHINHPNEISSELIQKVALLHEAGITVLNQAVLLKGINDSAHTQIALNEALFSARIQPYYLHMFDKVQGAAHFAISDERAVNIMREVVKGCHGLIILNVTSQVTTT